jgi:hypothetical protein
MLDASRTMQQARHASSTSTRSDEPGGLVAVRRTGVLLGSVYRGASAERVRAIQ